MEVDDLQTNTRYSDDVVGAIIGRVYALSLLAASGAAVKLSAAWEMLGTRTY